MKRFKPKSGKSLRNYTNSVAREYFLHNFWCLLGLLGYLGSGLGVTFGTGCPSVIFFKKCGSADSMPLSSGSAIFAGLDLQVGTVGVQKSYRRTALATFGRLGGGRMRGALSELWKPSRTARPQPRLRSRRRAKSI